PTSLLQAHRGLQQSANAPFFPNIVREAFLVRLLHAKMGLIEVPFIPTRNERSVGINSDLHRRGFVSIHSVASRRAGRFIWARPGCTKQLLLSPASLAVVRHRELAAKKKTDADA